MINFQDYTIADNDRCLDYLRRCIQIPSNASPITLLGNKDINNIRRGYADGLCWHKFTVNGNEFWGVPLGDWDEINWREVFKAHVPAGTIFSFVPEYLVKLWQKIFGADIQVDGNRDDWDYILYLDRMEKLSGKSLKGFRQHRNTFEKKYNYTVENITPEILDELRTFHGAAEENLQSRIKVLDIAQDDDEKFHFLLDHWSDAKNLFGFVVRVDGQIVAYAIDELIDETHSIGLFAKADYNFDGVNQFVYWYDAKISLERGILTQNLMDDVGEENLRYFKEHLSPLVMLKKYTVTYAPADTADARDVKISAERDENALTVKISGRLDTNSALSAKDEILAAIDGAQKVVFDLGELKYISSAGLRILIAAMKEIKSHGGTMTLKNVAAQVREVLDMTGFAQIFDVEA